MARRCSMAVCYDDTMRACWKARDCSWQGKALLLAGSSLAWHQDSPAACLAALQVVGSLEGLNGLLISPDSSTHFPRTMELLHDLLQSTLDIETVTEAYK
jgi:hypothetical protein